MRKAELLPTRDWEAGDSPARYSNGALCNNGSAGYLMQLNSFTLFMRLFIALPCVCIHLIHSLIIIFDLFDCNRDRAKYDDNYV